MKKTICFIIALAFFSSAKAQFERTVYDSYNKYGRLLMYIEAYYVDSADVAQLTEKAIVNTLKNLDPHSTYLSADDVKLANEPLEGNFEGIGVEFNILNDTLIVVTPISGGPSEVVGIRASDRVVEVDGENIAGVGLKSDRVYKLLRGPKGTKVTLTIVRKEEKEPLLFTVVRDKIPIHSLEAAYEVEPGLLYLRLGRFSLTTIEEMNTALKKIKRTPNALILDLRGNSGGVLQTAIDLCDQFFEEGRMLVYTEGQNFPKAISLSTEDGFFKHGKMVLLIDEGSASASEIVAGAIQDWDRGIIIGRRSFGKGLVQQLMPLTDGSQVRLTVARYHTPTGRVIQRPYDAGQIDKYYEDFFKRLHGDLQQVDENSSAGIQLIKQMSQEDSLQFPDSLKYYTLTNHRIVYGGGGIMPDIFMPVDTSFYSEYYSKISRAGLFNQFVLQYMDRERGNLQKRYKTFADFNRHFAVSTELFGDFLRYVETQKIPQDEAALTVSGEHMRLQLKALIARTLWADSEYYQTLNIHVDKSFQKAVDIIKNWNTYEKEFLY